MTQSNILEQLEAIEAPKAKRGSMGSIKSKKSNYKSTIVIEEDIKTGNMTATHKFFKKDGALFTDLSPSQQDCEILLWARTNVPVWKEILKAFIEAHSKPQEEYADYVEIQE